MPGLSLVMSCRYMLYNYDIMTSGKPKPLLTRMPPDSLPDSLHAAWQASMALRGDGTFFEVFGNNPALYDWYTEQFYGEVFNGGTVPRRIKELVRLRLSTIHGCRFCNQGNRQDALAAGLTEAEIDGLADYENATFSAAEKAVLRLADQMLLTNPDGVLSKTLYDDLKHHFSDGELLELGMIMAVLSGMAKFLFAFDLVEKEDYCVFGSADKR